MTLRCSTQTAFYQGLSFENLSWRNFSITDVCVCAVLFVHHSGIKSSSPSQRWTIIFLSQNQKPSRCTFWLRVQRGCNFWQTWDLFDPETGNFENQGLEIKLTSHLGVSFKQDGKCQCSWLQQAVHGGQVVKISLITGRSKIQDQFLSSHKCIDQLQLQHKWQLLLLDSSDKFGMQWHKIRPLLGKEGQYSTCRSTLVLKRWISCNVAQVFFIFKGSGDHNFLPFSFLALDSSGFCFHLSGSQIVAVLYPFFTRIWPQQTRPMCGHWWGWHQLGVLAPCLVHIWKWLLDLKPVCSKFLLKQVLRLLSSMPGQWVRTRENIAADALDLPSIQPRFWQFIYFLCGSTFVCTKRVECQSYTSVPVLMHRLVQF